MFDQAQGKYPTLATPRRSDLCYATTNRQSAVAALAEECDLILVVGSESSSNTKALVRVSREHGCAAYRIDDAAAIKEQWLADATTVGVTAGASAPDHLVQEVIDRVAPTEGVRLLRVTEEDEYFPLPPQLRHLLRALEALVRAGVGGSTADEPGLLERDAEWTATEALGEMAAPGSTLRT